MIHMQKFFPPSNAHGLHFVKVTSLVRLIGGPALPPDPCPVTKRCQRTLSVPHMAAIRCTRWSLAAIPTITTSENA